MSECLECQKPFKGRSDKKFCSDQCRSQFHNKLNADNNRLLNKVNAILRRNRLIIKELYSNGICSIDKNHLIERGFRFDYCTGFEEASNIYSYYDFSLSSQNKSHFRIIQKDI